MKIVIEDTKIIIYLNKNTYNFNIKEKEEIENYIKKLILRLNKKEYLDISGLYKVKVYLNNKYGMIIELINEEVYEFFPDVIDLKLIIYKNSNIYLELDDYFLLDEKEGVFYKDKYYINIDKLSFANILKLSEFAKFIYGDEVSNLEKRIF